MSATNSPEYQVSILGGFECRAGGRTVRISRGAQRLLAFLVLEGWPQARSFVAGSLWPEVDEQRALLSLRRQIWQVRSRNEHLVVADSETVALGSTLTIDYVSELEHLRASILSPTRRPDIDEIDGALRRSHVFQDLLPGWYEDWVLVEQERWRQLRLHALETISDSLCTEGRADAAVDAALAATSADPLRESAQRSLVRAFLAEGNCVEAARAYKEFRRRLNDMLGVEPGEELKRLIESMHAVRVGDSA